MLTAAGLLATAVVATPLPQAEAAPSLSVVMVSGSASLSYNDRAVRTHLVGQGHVVSVLDDDVARASSVSADVVIVTSSISPSKLDAGFKSLGVPIVVWEPHVYDDLGMASSKGETGNTSSVTISGSHPIAGGLSGSQKVTTSVGKMSWGRPSAGATVVATIGGSGSAAVFAYDTGASMVSGKAPARRVALFPNYVSTNKMTVAGKAILDNAIAWAVDGTTNGGGGGGSPTPTPVPPAPTPAPPGPTPVPTPVPPQPPSPSSLSVVIVSGSGSLSANDRAVRTHLVGQGHVVSVLDDDVARASSVSADVVIVTSSISPSKLDAGFKSLGVPIVVWEPHVYDDLGMASSKGETGNTSSVTISGSHPIAGGLSGSQKVTTSVGKMSWGRPSAGATVVATIGGSGSAAVFAYDTGASMVSGKAPARRVALFPNYVSTNKMTVAGKAILDNAIAWAVDGTTNGGGGGGGGGGDTTGPKILVFYGNSQSFGTRGLVQPDVNVLGRATDSSGVRKMEYRLNGGAWKSLSLGDDSRRLALPGDFNAAIRASTLRGGANTVVLRATDGAGNVSTTTVTVRYTANRSWPRTTTTRWGSGSLLSLAQPVDGRWYISGSRVRVDEAGYDRLLAIGDDTWKSYQVVTDFTVHGIDNSGYQHPSNGPGIGLIAHWQGHSGTGSPAWGFKNQFGAIAWYRYRDGGKVEIKGPSAATLTSKPFTLNTGTTYKVKFQAIADSGQGPLYRIKIWRQGTAEPSSWTVSTRTPPGSPDEGSLALVAHHVEVSFGTVQVTRL